MKRNRVLALAAAAALFPGCYVVSKAVPLDPSGMEYPLDHLSREFDGQVDRTVDAITGLPRTCSDHVDRCWHNLTRDPSRQ